MGNSFRGLVRMLADRVAILGHVSPNGTFKFADFGTCAF